MCAVSATGDVPDASALLLQPGGFEGLAIAVVGTRAALPVEAGAHDYGASGTSLKFVLPPSSLPS
jgi:hypothetical protein